MNHDSFVVFTDGAAKGNPGPGGWGVVVVTPDLRVIELGAGSATRTNNKMELGGAIAALEFVAGHPDAPVAIYTDLAYRDSGHHAVGVGLAQARVEDVAQGGDVLNRELLERLSALVARARAAA